MLKSNIVRKITASSALAIIAGLYPIEAAPSSTQGKDLVMRSVAELWSHGDLSAASTIYAHNFICHNLVGPDWHGVKGIMEAVKSHRLSFPDWEEHVDEIIEEGDRVAVRFTATGTQRGPFVGIAPTGRKVTVKEASFYRVMDGKIVEQWGMPDVNGMLTQLRKP